jgi:hypothetical protein
MENRHLGTTGQLLCGPHPFASAAAYWSTGVFNVRHTIDTHFMFACNKIKSAVDRTYIRDNIPLKVPPIAMSNERNTRNLTISSIISYAMIPNDLSVFVGLLRNCTSQT